MLHRQLVSLAAMSIATLALAGCPDSAANKDDSATSGGKHHEGKEGKEGKKHEHGAKGEKGEKGEKAEGTAKPESGGTAKAGGEGKFGTATIKGVVDFTGKAPEMKPPAKRKEAEFCKDKVVKYNAVEVEGGKLKDVFVRLAPGAIKGEYKGKPGEIDQKDCMYEPRMQGVVAGSEIVIKNGDGTLHNVHTFKGTETWFNQAQPKGSDALKKEMPDENKIVKFTCDVHPWMHGFVIVNENPFFAVSKANGEFEIEKVPAGEYEVEAWHSQYGLKKAKVKVEDGKAAEVKFSYDGTEAEPAENKDELKGLF